MRFLLTLMMLLVTRLEAKEPVFTKIACSKIIDTRLDPIVNPGTCSGHLHSVFGGMGFGDRVIANNSVDEQRYLTNTNLRTSCETASDRSMYWVPALYQKKNNKLALCDLKQKSTYYRKSTVEPTKAFPLGLQMVWGDAGRTTDFSDKDESEGLIRWICVSFPGGSNKQGDFYTGSWKGLPNNCQRLRATFFYADCVRHDKQNRPVLTSNDQSHVFKSTYKNSLERQCILPKGYDKRYNDNWTRVPRLEITVDWEVDGLGRDLQLSTGDKRGVSFHADFISAWDEQLLQRAINNCDDIRSIGANQPGCPLYDNKQRVRDATAMGAKSQYFWRPAPVESVNYLNSLPNPNFCPKYDSGKTPPAGSTGGSTSSSGGGGSTYSPPTSYTAPAPVPAPVPAPAYNKPGCYSLRLGKGAVEYELRVNDVVGAGKWTITAMAKISNDWSGKPVLLHSRWWDAANNIIGTTPARYVAGAFPAYQPGQPRDKWTPIQVQFDTNGKRPKRMTWYLGYPGAKSDGSSGYRYVKDLQLTGPDGKTYFDDDFSQGNDLEAFIKGASKGDYSIVSVC